MKYWITQISITQFLNKNVLFLKNIYNENHLCFYFWTNFFYTSFNNILFILLYKTKYKKCYWILHKINHVKKKEKKQKLIHKIWITHNDESFYFLPLKVKNSYKK